MSLFNWDDWSPLKAGGTWVELIVGKRSIVSNDEYLQGEYRDFSNELEISEGEEDIDIFLHEVVHLGQYQAGRYGEDVKERSEDEGWEDVAGQVLRTFILDNAVFVVALTIEIVSRGPRWFREPLLKRIKGYVIDTVDRTLSEI
jgi:hypothetical protein